VVIQGKVWPKRKGSVATDEGQLRLMETMASLWKVAAWKAYPHEADNWAMDDERYGIPFIEKGRALGIKIFAVHKGLGSASPVDMPVVAKLYPDCAFIVFHAGVDNGMAEQAYDAARTWGMDRLIASWERNGKPGNVYADLGSVWNTQQGMSATAAGHLLGKLLLSLGEDKICWGTDALVVGQPGPQIASFNAYQIPQQLQEQFGYPALTPAIKAKILGGNLAKVYGLDPAAALKAVTEDELTRLRTLTEAGEIPYLPHRGYGPRTRREFFAMLRDPGHPARG
jgi:predicted TIM-barrel fold metal-dependent hydrolase